MKKVPSLKRIIEKTKSFLLNFVDKKKCSICFSLVFLSSTLLLFSGAANNKTNRYKSASYFANIVKSNPNVDNVAMVVEQNGQETMPDTASELRGLYGAFGNRVTNYAGTINAKKDKQINYVDYPFESNLSFVYIQAGVQVSVSKANENHYRAEFYPLDLMFDFYANDPHNFYSFLYISTGQARQIIDYNHPGYFDKAIPLSELAGNPDFIQICKDELLGKGINLSFDGVKKTYQITNIFYEEYYFYETVYDTIGEFMVGYNQYPDGFNKQATYFLNEYEYQNEFYLNYIKEKYGKGDYTFGAYSIQYKGDFDNTAITAFVKQTSNTLSIVLLIFSIGSVCLAVFCMFKYHLFNLTFCLYFLLSFLVPYFIGSLIWLISKNIIFFSPFYTIGLLIYLIVITTCFVTLFEIKKHIASKEVCYD